MADNVEAWKKLDKLAEEWYALPAEGNEAQKQALAERLFAGVAALVPKHWLEALGSFWLKDWSKFDPGKGTFSGFVNARLKRCAEDLKHEDQNQQRQTKADPNPGENKTQWVDRTTSLNASAGTEGEGEVGDLVSGPTQAPDRLTEGMLLVALALDLRKRLTEEGRGEQNRYFPLFFTDGVADLVQQDEISGLDEGEERKIFAAMRLPFLDFFTQQECRTIAAVRMTDLKPYGELVEGRPMDETALPLPGDVYIAYLNKVEDYKVSAAAISLQRKAYRAFRKQLDIF